jgi:hypothetical protein
VPLRPCSITAVTRASDIATQRARVGGRQCSSSGLQGSCCRCVLTNWVASYLLPRFAGAVLALEAVHGGMTYRSASRTAASAFPPTAVTSYFASFVQLCSAVLHRLHPPPGLSKTWHGRVLVLRRSTAPAHGRPRLQAHRSRCSSLLVSCNTLPPSPQRRSSRHFISVFRHHEKRL